MVSPTSYKANKFPVESIKDAASTSTYAMMRWYAGNETGYIPGSFPTKWWEGSALFMGLLQYWQFTGDDQYNDALSQGLQWQSGDDGNYMPTNYSSYLVSTSHQHSMNPQHLTVLRNDREMTIKCSGVLLP